MAKLTFLTGDTEKMSPSQSSEVDEQPVDQNTVKISNRSLDYPLTPIDINFFFSSNSYNYYYISHYNSYWLQQHIHQGPLHRTISGGAMYTKRQRIVKF